MSDPQQPGPLAAVLDALKATTEELTATKAEVTALKEEFKGEAKYLRRYGRKNRKWILFDVVITVALSLFGYLSVHAIQSAGHANSAQLALCQAGNVSRAQQVQLWEHVVAVSSPAPGGTKAQIAREKAQAAEFLAYIHKVFASRDCNRLGR